MDVDRRKRRIAWLSVGSNSSLVVGKLIIGLFIGSVSVISEAIHSAVDLLAAIIALFAVRSSGKPADREHPFGHGKWESISGAVEALLIFVAAAWIVWEAVHKLLVPGEIEGPGWGVAVMAVSSAMNFVVSHVLFKVGKETESMALQADAWHLRTDVYTSAGVTAGLIVIWLGERFFPGVDIRWIDPVVAIAVALLIVRAAWHLTRDAIGELLDTRLPDEEVSWIESYVAAQKSVVRSIHRLRTRRSGAVRYIDFHLVVDPEMTVVVSHELSHRIAEAIREHFPNSQVIAHIEPCDGRCPERCVAGCQLPEAERATCRDR
jgi:cation diffusion facilitator family transporter